MTREEIKEFAVCLKNNYTIDFDKLPDFCDSVISDLSECKHCLYDGAYIKKEDALSCFTWQNTKKDVWFAIKDLPTFSLSDSVENKGDTVSRVAYEQIMWERDTAIQQLKDLGYGLGEKPKENKGEWIRTRTWEHDGELYCSVCGSAPYDERDCGNFCPNCGADMRGE